MPSARLSSSSWCFACSLAAPGLRDRWLDLHLCLGMTFSSVHVNVHISPLYKVTSHVEVEPILTHHLPLWRPSLQIRSHSEVQGLRLQHTFLGGGRETRRVNTKQSSPEVLWTVNSGPGYMDTIWCSSSHCCNLWPIVNSIFMSTHLSSLPLWTVATMRTEMQGLKNTPNRAPEMLWGHRSFSAFLKHQSTSCPKSWLQWLLFSTKTKAFQTHLNYIEILLFTP
jgi:hypothetical protein